MQSNIRVANLKNLPKFLWKNLDGILFKNSLKFSAWDLIAKRVYSKVLFFGIWLSFGILRWRLKDKRLIFPETSIWFRIGYTFNARNKYMVQNWLYFYCAKSVQIRSFSLVRIFLYSDWIQENTDQKRPPQNRTDHFSHSDSVPPPRHPKQPQKLRFTIHLPWKCSKHSLNQTLTL